MAGVVLLFDVDPVINTFNLSRKQVPSINHRKVNRGAKQGHLDCIVIIIRQMNRFTRCILIKSSKYRETTIDNHFNLYYYKY